MRHSLSTNAGILTFMFSLVGCQAGPATLSQGKVVRGERVKSSSQGPDGLSTVALQIAIGREEAICTGVLIEPTVVLTAGHCVLEGNVRVKAYFGLEMPRDSNSANFIPVSKVSMHPDYRDKPRGSDLPDNDVAVLTLERPAPNGYRPVRLLQDEGKLTRGLPVRLAGYGITEDNNGDGILRVMDSVYEGPDGHGTFSTSNTGRRGACDGDSGAPLFARLDGDWHVIGVVSGSDDPCGGRDTFSSVPYHFKFIDTTRAAVKV